MPRRSWIVDAMTSVPRRAAERDRSNKPLNLLDVRDTTRAHWLRAHPVSLRPQVGGAQKPDAGRAPATHDNERVTVHGAGHRVDDDAVNTARAPLVGSWPSLSIQLL